jgi:gamma-glutamylcyclotransferase (GGCT)/AIG2-like uncharacterized protein YtfP
LTDDNQLLFVYGSLTNPVERLRLLGRSIEANPARLTGYARGRKRYYFVTKQADAVTDGAILSGLSARDLAILDEYEEVPTLYTRERVEVISADGHKIECWIYLPTDWAGDSGGFTNSTQ